MKSRPCVLAAIGLWASCFVAAARAQPAGFEDADWVWFSPSTDIDSQAMPACIRYFRAGVTLPENEKIESAELMITADNLYTVFLNGASVGESDTEPNAWNKPKRFDVKKLVAAGRNVVAVEAANSAPGPAGLLVKLVVHLKDGKQIVLVSDAAWKGNSREEPAWQQVKFDDSQWQNVSAVGHYGARPWGAFAVPPTPRHVQSQVGEVGRLARRLVERAAQQKPPAPVVIQSPSADFSWPQAVVFLGDDCSLYRPATHSGTSADSLTVTIFNARGSRAFPEHDLPAPMKIGRKLFLLEPARPGVSPRLLLDAGQGAIGSPSVSFDGETIFVSMARVGDPFFHIYQLPAGGGQPLQLTDGPFHDIDPAQMPDGRIVFTSTRIGTFEEYHNPPSRSLFVMNADGDEIRPITHTIIFDNEPEILSDGRILFIRSDNFFDRGKVETLLHAIRPDGTDGYTEFGLENGPEYGGRLRGHYCGSPAPMPDGRLAFLTDRGIAIGRLGYPSGGLCHFGVPAGDVAALPDGRLLCTLASKSSHYESIAVFDAQSPDPTLTVLFESTDGPLHSPVYLGARPRPPVLPESVDPAGDDDVRATGFLFCQNARLTQNTTAGWSHVRAIRVLAGQGLTTRSSHSYIVHAGSEVVELGAVPLAPDGSFSIEVPADTPLALQAVDAEGRSELNEMSWIYVRPGERRSCVGCHQRRQVAPSSSAPLAQALRSPPLKLLGRGQPHRFRGNNAAVTGLMELQFDRYREVAGINRHAASGEPLATGPQEVAELVAVLRGRDHDLAISAAQRLSIFRDASAASGLAECLGRSDRELRVAAALALAACGTRESVPPLLKSLADPDPLAAQAAAVALENLTGHAEPFNAFAAGDERDEQARAWRQWYAGTTWEDIEQELIHRLESPDRDVVRRAAVALGHTGGDATRAALRQYVAGERDQNPFPEWMKSHRGDGARFNSLSEANPRTLRPPRDRSVISEIRMP